MFWQIFSFELKYRIKRPATWIYFFIFFLLGFLTVGTGTSPATEKVMHNAPWVIADTNIAFSIFAMLICSAIMGVPLFRDIEHQTGNYLFAYPITKAGYFWGRFAGSFLFVLLIGTACNWGAITGSIVGPSVGWVPSERIGHYGLWNYFHPYFIFTIGNLLLSSAIFFALVSLSRNIKIIYTASILLVVTYFLATLLVADLEKRELVKLLDPFALKTFELETRFYTPFEKNSLPAPLSKMIIVNRLIWLGIAMLILGLAYRRFSFTKFLQPEKPDKRKVEDETVPLPPAEFIRNVREQFGSLHTLKVWRNLAKLEFLNIVNDNYFRAILGGGVILLSIDFWISNKIYGVAIKPLTIFLMDFKNYNYSLFVFIILLFYTGEAVHREKSTRFNILNDALPVSNTVFYLSKLAGLFCVAIVLCNIPIITGVIVQTLKGYTHYNFGVYFIEMYLLSLPGYLQMILLCFAVHYIINNKFAGHGVAVLIWITMFFMRNYGHMDYNLLFYFFTPNYVWSAMNGIGHFLKPQNWFNFYWLMFGALLVTIAFPFYRRGVSGGFKERWRVGVRRFNGWPRMLTTLFFIAWLSSGTFIYYNVSYLSNYYTAAETRTHRALYERTLKIYEALPQPKITGIIMKADIFPADRKMLVFARLFIKNKSTEAIHALHLSGQQNLTYDILYNGKPIAYTSPLSYPYSGFTLFKKGRDTLNYRIYNLPVPLQPGDTALVEVNTQIINNGFVNNGYSREIVYNGTFCYGGLPTFGYQPREELESDEYRKKYGLAPKKDDLPDQHDAKGINRKYGNDDADLVHFEAVLSTSPGQIAVAPGYLQKTWEQNGRSYFSYIQDTPVDNWYSFVSAKYEVLKDSVTIGEGKKINIEIFYDQQHAFNLNRFAEACKEGLKYYSKVYGPFQYRQMRLLEFPRYLSTAQSFPNAVPFAEDFGWVTDFKSPDDFDYIYFITAHEIAHQWWGLQVSPNYTRGSIVIAESLAEYTALLLTERKYGRENMKIFLRNELDGYLWGRANEAKKENPLIYCDRAYEWYNKGSLVLYGLRDLIGDSALNNALREFRDSFAMKENPPYAGSNDLYAFINKHTPDSFKYYLTDTWEKITLYENKLIKATAISTGRGEYDVTLEFSTKKLYADSTGKETAAHMNDYIDVAVFGAETRDTAGRKQVNPFFLQKYKLTQGVKKITIHVNGKPVKAGIDPFNKLIDRIPDDNLGDVEIE